MAQKDRFAHRDVVQGCAFRGGGVAAGVPEAVSVHAEIARIQMQLDLRNRSRFSEFSLCLSRACLGKMMIFGIKWRSKRRVFAYRARHAAHVLEAARFNLRVRELTHVKENATLLFLIVPLRLPRACLDKRSFSCTRKVS